MKIITEIFALNFFILLYILYKLNQVLDIRETLMGDHVFCTVIILTKHVHV